MDQHPSPRKSCYFLPFVIAILMLTIPRSGVLLASAQDDLAHGGKGVGANGTQTSEIGRSNGTVRIDCGPGHGGGNGYGGGGYHGGGNGYGKPWTPVPQGHYPMTVKGSAAADHGRGLWTARYCVLLVGATSWLLLFVFT